jgi:antitoxin MazE
MQAKLVKIGNSRGVRLPKAIIAQAGLTDQIDIAVRRNEVILRSASAKPRQGWDQAFRNAVASQGQDEPDGPWQSSPNAFDLEEWTW